MAKKTTTSKKKKTEAPARKPDAAKEKTLKVLKDDSDLEKVTGGVLVGGQSWQAQH